MTFEEANNSLEDYINSMVSYSTNSLLDRFEIKPARSTCFDCTRIDKCSMYRSIKRDCIVGECRYFENREVLEDERATQICKQ